jgi:hypothetical protein
LRKSEKRTKTCRGQINKSETISQKQKELSDDFEKEANKEVNKDKEDFKKRWRQK